MKRIFLFIIIIIAFNASLFAQNKKSKIDLKNVRKVKSRKEFKEEVVIKRPNQATEMERTETKSTVDMKINIHNRILKSNKLLY